MSLCDEVTSALDTVVGAALLDLMDGLRRELLQDIVNSYDRNREASELAASVEAAVAQTALLEAGAEMAGKQTKLSTHWEELADLVREAQALRKEMGLVVEEVTGPAAAAGIQPGDVVLSANGRPVQKVEDLRDAVKDAKEPVALLVQRGPARIFVPVEPA